MIIMALATMSTLKNYKSRIDFGTEESMAFSPGYAINFLIKRYSIPAVKWGYDRSIIGLETKNQYLFWKDNGGSLEFKGILDKKKNKNER